MKTIGVLGIGVQAGVDFQLRVHEAAGRRILPRTPAAYPPMLVRFIRHPPFVANEAFAPVFPLRPDPRLLEAARWLGGAADFLVMTANAPHRFRPEIEQAAGRPVLSMIDATLAEVRRRGWRRVGALAAFDHRATVYTEPLSALGLAFETIDAELQQGLNAAIVRVMEGRETDESRAAASKAVATLRARGVDGIIPGCTEIPLLLGTEMMAADLVNPAQVLAEAAVERAMEA